MKRKDMMDCSCRGPDADTCRIDAILSIDERGQIVIPKDVRESARIGPGDRIALVSCFQEGEIQCMMLIPAERLTGLVRNALSPVMKGIMREPGEV